MCETAAKLPTDFQNPFHLTVSDSQPSEGPNACLVQLLEIYFLVLVVGRSRSGAQFVGPAPLSHPVWSQPNIPPPLETLGDHRTHLHVYIPSCGEDASTPNLSYLFI